MAGFDREGEAGSEGPFLGCRSTSTRVRWVGIANIDSCARTSGEAPGVLSSPRLHVRTAGTIVTNSLIFHLASTGGIKRQSLNQVFHPGWSFH
jgi:hypothetical protein